MQKEEKMNFISKLYFGVFKRIGNLRLMFVVSCLYCAVSLLWISIHAYHHVKYVNIDKISLEETLNTYIEPAGMFRYGTKLSVFVDVSIIDLQMEKTIGATKMLSNILVAQKYCTENLAKESFAFWKRHYPDMEVFKDISSPQDFCILIGNKFNGLNHIIHTFGYLWNYLWVVFWFYFPFLIVLPIKFVVDGYKQDKRKKK